MAFAGSDSAVGPATGDVLATTDAGATWAALAVDPFGAGFHVMSVVSFMIGAATRRILAAREGTGGAVQGQVAFSDDNGATWTTVSIGGAAVGHGTVRGQGLYALDSRHIWLVGVDGYIYFSDDGGATWATQEAGVLAATDYETVHFADENFGVAGNAADVIVITSDGGSTWELATATGSGADITAVHRIDANKIWIGTDDGELWYTNDGGTTWTQRTGWVGDGVGEIRDIEFANQLVGYMTRYTAGPVGHILRTIDGGYTWDVLSTPANLGLNDFMLADESTGYAVGEAEGGTSVILKVSAA
jgi:photosystem II stability/assembly factor-like uncharacterized protein